MLRYWIWLAQCKGLSLHQKHGLLACFGSPEEIYNAGDAALIAAGADKQICDALEDKDLTEALAIKAKCAAAGIGIMTLSDAAYPLLLRTVADSPLLLYYRGKLPLWDDMPVVGIVGTRKATAYGMNTAAVFARQIAACGAIVVSGGASGIDAAAMWSAMATGKPVVGVLGCGVDVVYPAANRSLFSKVVESGCLLSEYPPGTPGHPWQFPARNRIISGMSDGVLIVEAPRKSGALNTAGHARNQGRDVFVVPANFDRTSCEGSNALLAENARAVLSGWALVKEYALQYPGKVEQVQVDVSDLQDGENRNIFPSMEPRLEKTDKKSIDKKEKSTYSVLNKATTALSQEEKSVLAQIGPEPISVDRVMNSVDLPPAAVKSILTKLCLKGLLVNLPGGSVARK